MNNRWLAVALVGSIALNVGVVGFYIYERLTMPAPPPMPEMGPEGRRHVKRMRTMFEPRMDSLREELATVRGGLMRLVQEPAVDRQKADSLLAEIGRVEQQMNRLAFEHACQLCESLPPEARKRFFERLEKGGIHGRRPGMRHWGRRPGPPGPGPECPDGM